MCVYIYIYTYTHTFTHKYAVSIHPHTHTHTHGGIHSGVTSHPLQVACIPSRSYTYIHVCMYACMYTCMHQSPWHGKAFMQPQTLLVLFKRLYIPCITYIQTYIHRSPWQGIHAASDASGPLQAFVYSLCSQVLALCH